MLRQMVKDFSKKELEPQAAEHDQKERFNLKLFRKLGELGLLGITVPTEYGGSQMDAVAAVIVHEEMSRMDPGFLSRLPCSFHAMCQQHFHQCQ